MRKVDLELKHGFSSAKAQSKTDRTLRFSGIFDDEVTLL